MTKVKICGLRREEDIDYVNQCLPDFAGFVFADSKRKVTREQVKKLKALLSPKITAVGVFVNEDMEKIAELASKKIIDMVQLHGDESNAYIEELRKKVKGLKIIKAVRVSSKEDVKRSEEIAADYILFDSFSIKEYGGTGKTFDWSLIDEIKRPFFLAGGIDSENVQEALKAKNIYAIDVSSAVETDGYKDKEKIFEMVNAIRK